MTKDLADELERLALKDGFCVFALRAFVDDNLPQIISALRSLTGEGEPVACPDREAVARIIDPDAWRVLDEYKRVCDARVPGHGIPTDRFTDSASLTKADAILALLSGGGE